jgi:hypothetical protein
MTAFLLVIIMLAKKAILLTTQSSGTNQGRLYLVYIDVTSSVNYDQDIFFCYSTNNGTSWSTATNLTSDGNQKSQYMPALSVDQSNGNVAIAWYDCRNDSQNILTQCFGKISRDVGDHFTDKIQLIKGSSDAKQLNYSSSFGYGDYLGLDYRNGFLSLGCSDNSNSTGDNPDYDSQIGFARGMDLYSCRFAY